MAVARFLLVGGVVPAGAGTPGWPAGPGAVGVREPGAGWNAWRLLGGNNRELGRSARAHPTADEVVAALTVLRERFAEVTAAHSTDPRGSWRWRLLLDDEPVVVSARAYLRQRESHYSLAQFLAVAPSAAGPRSSPGAAGIAGAA